jgi:hypothetical protein
MSTHETRTAPRRWVTVSQGSMADVLVLQGLLESNGFPTMLRDMNIKVVDPFITGGNAFAVDLQVPDIDASEALKVLAWRPDGEESAAAPPQAVVAAESEMEDSAETAVRALGNRIRFAALLTFSAPFALLLAPRYFRAVRRLGRKPDGHAWTIAALVYAALLLVLAAFAFVGVR